MWPAPQAPQPCGLGRAEMVRTPHVAGTAAPASHLLLRGLAAHQIHHHESVKRCQWPQGLQPNERHGADVHALRVRGGRSAGAQRGHPPPGPWGPGKCAAAAAAAAGWREGVHLGVRVAWRGQFLQLPFCPLAHTHRTGPAMRSLACIGQKASSSRNLCANVCREHAHAPARCPAPMPALHRRRVAAVSGRPAPAAARPRSSNLKPCRAARAAAEQEMGFLGACAAAAAATAMALPFAAGRHLCTLCGSPRSCLPLPARVVRTRRRRGLLLPAGRGEWAARGQRAAACRAAGGRCAAHDSCFLSPPLSMSRTAALA